MPRYGSKTYGRSSQTQTHASKAFDDILFDNNGSDNKPSTAKAAGTVMRWGKTSFTSTRGSSFGGNTSSEPDTKKRKVTVIAACDAAGAAPEPDNMLDDPFSFDLDDDAARNPSKSGVGASVARPKPNALKSLETNTRVIEIRTDPEDDDIIELQKQPVRSYSRVPKTQTKSLFTSSRDSRRQTYMDAFTNRRITVSKSVQQNNAGKKVNYSSRPKKFFTSSQSSADDHTYSQTSSDIVDDHDKESNGSDMHNYIDLDDLDSGDPEIIFNSPKKREEEVQRRVLMGLNKESSSSDEEIELLQEDDKASPITVSSTDSNKPASYSRFSSLRTCSRSPTSGFNDTDSTGSGPTSKPGLSKKLSLRDEEQRKKKLQEPIVRKLLTSPKKSLATYNPRQWHSGDETTGEGSRSGQNTAGGIFDDFDDEPEPVKVMPKMKRHVTWPSREGDEAVSSIKVQRDHKQLFTVVRNVKQAHEVQEHGETQEFADDIEYIMDGLASNKVPVRCLSTISLVDKCMMPGFRMHLRAHNTLAKVFGALHDAPQHPTLALCTAAVLYMLSRDRLNMDLEKSTLELMLGLLDVDPLHQNNSRDCKEYMRMQTRIRVMCEKCKKEGHAKNLNIENITTGNLAMETLLSLTSRRAGDWFKEELRSLGGLDHIVNTIAECIDDMDEYVIEPTESMLDRLRKIDRCLRVLENVSYLNTENQQYLLTYKSTLLVKTIAQVLRISENCIPFNAIREEGDDTDKECAGFIIFTVMLSILRVLLNLTHENNIGSSSVGRQPDLVKVVLACVLKVPQYVPANQRFDLMVLSLGLLINMTESSDTNRLMLLETIVAGSYDSDAADMEMKAIEAIIDVFITRLEAARRAEEEQEEERKRKKQEKEVQKALEQQQQQQQQHNGSQHGDPNETSEWQESESGLEWVMIPVKRNKDGVMVTGNEDDGHDSDSDSDDDDLKMLGNQEEDENFTKALHRAGKHMEDSIICAYISLLIGCVIQNNKSIVDLVRECLPDGDFEPMVRMLKKFLGFMNFTSSTNAGGKSIMKVIQILEAC